MGTSFAGACARAEGKGVALPINWMVAFGLRLKAETRQMAQQRRQICHCKKLDERGALLSFITAPP